MEHEQPRWLAIMAAACMTLAECSWSDSEDCARPPSPPEAKGGGGQAAGTGALGGTPTGQGEAGVPLPPCDLGPPGMSLAYCESATYDARHPDTNWFSMQEVQILLVVDRSSSMDQVPSGFLHSKWDALKAALLEAFTAADRTVAFGLELFPRSIDPEHPISPNCEADCCMMPADPTVDVPFDAYRSGIPSVIQAMEAASPGGSRPTARALARAREYLATLAPVTGSRRIQRRFVLLITDGGPLCNPTLPCTPQNCAPILEGLCTDSDCCAAQLENCVDVTATQNEVMALATAGIPTIVVGLPGSEPYAQHLELLAAVGLRRRAGAPPSYFALGADQGEVDLANLLSLIVSEVGPACDLTLQPAPDPEYLVLVDCVPLSARADAVGDRASWFLGVEGDGLDRVRLGGPLCGLLRTGQIGRIDVILGCWSSP
jgi:hypothetical protein